MNGCCNTKGNKDFFLLDYVSAARITGRLFFEILIQSETYLRIATEWDEMVMNRAFGMQHPHAEPGLKEASTHSWLRQPHNHQLSHGDILPGLLL